MKHARVLRFRFPRTSIASLLAAAASLLIAMPASADDYADVNQLIRTGKLAEAQAKAERYIAANPRDPQMRFLQSVVQSQSGKADDAIATLTALVREYPELPEPYNNLAVLYAGQKQYDKARTALEMAIRNNPNYGTAYENLGDIYLRLAAQSYGTAQQRGAANAALQAKQNALQSIFAPAGQNAAPNRGAARRSRVDAPAGASGSPPAVTAGSADAAPAGAQAPAASR
ncbi:MAG: tetratricopeptide repeat protein [Xylophilus ampelinus]